MIQNHHGSKTIRAIKSIFIYNCNGRSYKWKTFDKVKNVKIRKRLRVKSVDQKIKENAE